MTVAKPNRALRSPLKDPPIRNPGQSIQDEMDRVWEDEFMDHMVLIAFALMVFMAALIQYFIRMPPEQFLLVSGVLVVLFSSYAVPKMIQARTKLKRLKLGRDGERAVAECLDLLRDDGYRVLHDIVADGFNIDHVLIGPQGVFTVETKTLSKPERRDARVHFDGQEVLVNGHAPDSDPVVQAKAQASWLRQMLEASTGKRFTVRGIVAYPGWFIERSGGAARSAVWVLEPKAIQAFVRNEPTWMKDEDIQLATFHLKRYIRSAG